MSLTTAIGLMSGTSMDGIDVSTIRTDGVSLVERGPSSFIAYEAAFSRRIEAALTTATGISDRSDRPGDLSALEQEITKRHAAAVISHVSTSAAPFDGPELIGFHGQTILHRPKDALTVQLGDGAALAEKTGLTVISDMRANDMRFGGEGAPLAPAYHVALAHSLNPDFKTFPIAFVNIGGISNVTWVPEQGDPLAFDCGPGNALIDQWVSLHAGVPLDQFGRIASEGGISNRVVTDYLAQPFFEMAVPKSLDRGDFTLDLAAGLDLSDGARTLAAVTGHSIFAAAKHMPGAPKLWILCGGGRKNPHIAEDLATLAVETGARVVVAEEVGINGDFVESEAWAYLAVRALNDLPLSFPTTTGCRKAVSGGVLSTPQRLSALSKRSWSLSNR